MSPQKRDIGLRPRILMAANDNTRSVPVKIENLTRGKFVILIEPVLQSEVSVNVVGG